MVNPLYPKIKRTGGDATRLFGTSSQHNNVHGARQRFEGELKQRKTIEQSILADKLRLAGLKIREEKSGYCNVYCRIFIVDIWIRWTNICIEVDGGYHESPSQKRKDDLRDKILAERGLVTVRFTNKEAVEFTCDQIAERIKSHKNISMIGKPKKRISYPRLCLHSK